MNTSRTRAIQVFFLCLLMILSQAQASEIEKVSPLPITEVESIVSNWLWNSGFTIYRSELGMGRVRLKAVGLKQTLIVSLKPRSPLATTLGIDPAGDAGKPLNKEKMTYLWKDLKVDLGPTAAVAGRAVRNHNGFPSAVLSKIESVVCIKSIVNEDQWFQVSGFVVDPTGLIVCTAHNLKGSRGLQVFFFDGLRKKGRIVKIDHKIDLALVKIDMNPDTYVSMANGRELLGMGEAIYSIGCPKDLGGTVYEGIVNGPPRRVKDQVLWQVDMEIFHGSSGSPVFDARGNIAAVVKGRFRGISSVGFLIPFDSLMKFLNEAR